jgi:hypothetical protein
MQHRPFLFFLLSVPLVCTGCASSAWIGIDAFVAGYTAGRASVEPAVETPLEEDPPEARIELVPVGPTEEVSFESSAPSAPLPRPFDLGGAYAAMSRVDLSACKADGLTAGYGRAVVAFAQDGTVSGVSVELPPASAADARACVDSAFRAARIPAFAGSQPTSVRRAFYVA